MKKKSCASDLFCPNCGKEYSISSVHTIATCCNQPLLVKYEIPQDFSKELVSKREASMWRYAEMLPVMDHRNIISLGEGMTPLISMDRLAQGYGISKLLLKDEAFNPTGSFKARGMSMALSKARELGIHRFIIPSAGNAGAALAAYCAHSGMECIVVMPEHSPEILKKECRFYGAQLVLVNGLIHDCGKKINEINKEGRYFDLSTLKEPYRLEGKKTMGYEIAEQLHWTLPDVVVYPTGGGTGLIGIWKAFGELYDLNWIKKPFPKMIAVQSANCASIGAASLNPGGWKKDFSPSASIASGLIVPFPFGMDLMQKLIKESDGCTIAVSDASIVEGIREVAHTEGILLSPEGAAAWQGLKELRQKNVINSNSTVVFLNTASGYKYPDQLSL